MYKGVNYSLAKPFVFFEIPCNFYEEYRAILLNFYKFKYFCARNINIVKWKTTTVLSWQVELGVVFGLLAAL